MKAVWKAIAFVGSPLLALIAFMANQSATETQENITSYAANPLIRSLPVWLHGIAQSAWFLAVTFFILGCVATVLFKRLREKRGKLSPTEKFATELSLAGFSLDNMSSIAANPATLANVNVVINKLRQRGYDTPPLATGRFSKDKLSYYFHQVAAYLEEDDVAAAKGAAKSLVAQWNSQ